MWQIHLKNSLNGVGVAFVSLFLIRFLPAAKTAGQWIMIVLLLRSIFEIQAVGGQMDMATYVIEFTDLKFEVRLDL